METIRPRRRMPWRRAVAGGTLLVLAAAGCSGNESGEAPSPPQAPSASQDDPAAAGCRYTSPNAFRAWRPITEGVYPYPDAADIQRMAQALGVSVLNMRKGWGGPVDCDPGIPITEPYHFGAVVKVEGIPTDKVPVSNQCYAFFSEILLNPGVVAAHLRSMHPAVACPPKD